MKKLKTFENFLNEIAYQEPNPSSSILDAAGDRGYISKDKVAELMKPLIGTQLLMNVINDEKKPVAKAKATVKEVKVGYDCQVKDGYTSDFRFNLKFEISDKQGVKEGGEFERFLTDLADTTIIIRGGGNQYRTEIIFDGSSSSLSSYNEYVADKNSTFFTKLSQLLKFPKGITWYPEGDYYKLGAGKV